MDWHELDALADELRRTLARGTLRPPPAAGCERTQILTPERLARITLADIEHVRTWESTHPRYRTSQKRLQELADDIRRLLSM